MKKNEQPQHTQGEWSENGVIVLDKNERVIARTHLNCGTHNEQISTEEAEANAQRIVKAVNMHDELIEAIEQISIYAKSYDEWLHHYGGNHMTTQKQSYAGLLEKIKNAKKLIEQAKQK